MRHFETVISYPGTEAGSGYVIRTYDSSADFVRREFFEHRHADFEVSVILSGYGTYRLRDCTVEVARGDVFLMGTNQIHCITESDADDPVVLFNVQFEPRIIWSPLSNMISDSYVALFNGRCCKLDPQSPVSDEVKAVLMRIRGESQAREPGWQVLVKAYLCEIIGLLMRDFGELPEESGDAKREGLIAMDRAMNYINDNLDDELTLEAISSVAGFSRNYFSTFFRELNGLSPWEYINLRRTEKAGKLLAGTDLPMAEIAGRCGYRNISYFNRTYLRVTGQTPSEYRKNKKGI